MTTKGLTVLQEIYLSELNLLHRLKDDAVASERGELIRRAVDAEKRVNQAFEDLANAGRLKELSATYKRKRLEKKAKGQSMIPWSAFILDEKRRMMRTFAQEQKDRARRGLKP